MDDLHNALQLSRMCIGKQLMVILKMVGTVAKLLELGNRRQDLDNRARMQGPSMWRG